MSAEQCYAIMFSAYNKLKIVLAVYRRTGYDAQHEATVYKKGCKDNEILKYIIPVV